MSGIFHHSFQSICKKKKNDHFAEALSIVIQWEQTRAENADVRVYTLQRTQVCVSTLCSTQIVPIIPANFFSPRSFSHSCTLLCCFNACVLLWPCVRCHSSLPPISIGDEMLISGGFLLLGNNQQYRRRGGGCVCVAGGC